jgi:hypothetical protein
MSKELKDLTVAVIDEGVFLHLAQRLVGQVGRVLYFRESEEFLPTVKRCIIGQGYEGIERIPDFWPIKKEIDLFVFPSNHRAGLQLELESQGFPVWGPRNGIMLENNRQAFLDTLAEIGLKVPPHEVIMGMTKLRDHLRDKEDKWIKVSKLRGDLETMHWRNWSQDEHTLDYLVFKFGPAKDLIRFFVFDAINTSLEPGFDTISVDGQFPNHVLNTMECKDKASFCTVMTRAELPDDHNQILDSIGPVLKRYNFRQFFGVEFRKKGEDFWFTDGTMRVSYPPGGSVMDLCGNLAKILWHGAHGEMIDYEPTAKYAAECSMSCKGPQDAWEVVEFPSEIMPHAKCANGCMIDGRVCFPPDEQNDPDIGFLVATGDTITETISNLKELEAMLPDGVTCNSRSLYDIIKEAEEAEKADVPLTNDALPDPEVALKD